MTLMTYLQQQQKQSLFVHALFMLFRLISTSLGVKNLMNSGEGHINCRIRKGQNMSVKLQNNYVNKTVNKTKKASYL